MSKSIDHRWGSRFSSDVDVEMRAADGSINRAVVRNVSLSGALLETRNKVRLLGQVDVRPLRPSATWMRGFVVRLSENCVAVEWFEPGLDPVNALVPMGRGFRDAEALEERRVPASGVGA